MNTQDQTTETRPEPVKIIVIADGHPGRTYGYLADDDEWLLTLVEAGDLDNYYDGFDECPRCEAKLETDDCPACGMTAEEMWLEGQPVCQNDGCEHKIQSGDWSDNDGYYCADCIEIVGYVDEAPDEPRNHNMPDVDDSWNDLADRAAEEYFAGFPDSDLWNER